MTELYKSYRYYKVCMNGLNPFSVKSHKFALNQTLNYRKQRIYIVKHMQLGYWSQIKNLFRSFWSRKEIAFQNEKYQEYVRNQNNKTKSKQQQLDSDIPEVKMHRVDYFQEVKAEQDYQRKQQLNNIFFKIQMKAQALYYGMNVQSLANQLSQFLKLYHESLQGLVQGYRETTMDAKGEFKFEDGSSVQDKLDKYENKLHEYSTGFAKEIQKQKELHSSQSNKTSDDKQQ